MAAAGVLDGDASAAAAADILCSLRHADLGAVWELVPWSSTPQLPPPPIWPTAARGKRSRRSPSAAAVTSSASGHGKGKWLRSSPASPLENCASTTTTSGEEGSSSFLAEPTLAAAGAACGAASKVGLIGQQQQVGVGVQRSQPGQRPRKKMRLPEAQELVRSLKKENDTLHKNIAEMQKACRALSKENRVLESRLEQRDKQVKKPQPKDLCLVEHRHAQSVLPCPAASFVLPDLNLPLQEEADGLALP